MNLVLPEAFPENILSIISQQNTDCANVMLTTFLFNIQKDHIITLSDLKESELATNIDSMMPIFHHYNRTNILISHFPIMTAGSFESNITETQQTSFPLVPTPPSPTQSFGGFWETPYLPWMPRMKKPRFFLTYLSL